jgi:uncharacterized ferritin-like protein (DUF455 family)
MLQIKEFVSKHRVPPAIETLHSLCHIEYNAIKSYIDTMIRFSEAVKEEHRKEFWVDFSQVSLEETLHLNMLMSELETRGANYGTLPAHDSLHQRAT